VFFKTLQKIERINLYDLNGRKTACELVDNSYLSTKELATGMYLIQVTYSNGEQVSKKILVN